MLIFFYRHETRLVVKKHCPPVYILLGPIRIMSPGVNHFYLFPRLTEHFCTVFIYLVHLILVSLKNKNRKKIRIPPPNKYYKLLEPKCFGKEWHNSET